MSSNTVITESFNRFNELFAPELKDRPRAFVVAAYIAACYKTKANKVRLVGTDRYLVAGVHTASQPLHPVLVQYRAAR